MILFVKYWVLVIVPVHLASRLIDETTTHAEIQHSFALLTSLLVRVQCAIALSNFLIHDPRGSPFTSELGEVFKQIKTLESFLLDRRIITPFCGHFKFPKDKLVEELTNSFQLFSGNPWIVNVRNDIIKHPIIGTDTKKLTRRKLLNEAINDGTLEFCAHNKYRRIDKIRSSLIKYIKPFVEQIVADELEKRFAIRIQDIASIHLLFETDMPEFGMKLNGSRMKKGVSLNDLKDIYAQFPDFIFKPKIK